MIFAELCCWVAMLWVGYVYVGYPLVLYVIGRRPRTILSGPMLSLPYVSVLISAWNEEKDIEWKIRETLEWDYPRDRLQVLVASDASSDRTDEIIQSISDTRLNFVRMDRRGGKNIALNRLAALAQGELLLFTDANAHISCSSFRALIQHFQDPQVGCVTGWEQNLGDERVLSAAGKTSLGYEAWVNTLESRLGSVLVCDGSLFCIRKSVFKTLQPDLANDLELPIWIGHRGYKILYEPKARSIEKPTSSAREEFERRRRICGQGALGLWRLRGYLHGLRRWQFLSRKFLRWLSLIPIIVVIISSIRLSQNWFFRAALEAEIVFGLAALVGLISTLTGRHTTRATSLPFYFLLVNFAALVGVAEACLGRRFRIWDIPSLSRGQGHTAV